MTATAQPLPDAARAAERSNKMPSSIWFIVSNEFAERFCFYGINSILALYMTNHLHFTDAKAASWQSLFKSGAYFFPILGAIVSDVFWGKFRTIAVFSLIYAAGCVSLALLGSEEMALAASLFFVGLGTGGIKPCVSTNVGDQFTSKNQHLIEKAFSWFYLSINIGSSVSIFLCPILLDDPNWGPKWAFGMPAIMMVAATVVFVSGRAKYAAVPPAGRKWIEEVTSPKTLKLIGSLIVIYLFVSVFWMLWDQSNGNTWTLQASSSLMDKSIFGLITLKGAQVQVVNGLFILILAPAFSYGVYPFIAKYTKVTPLRKIGAGLFITALSFVIIAWIEKRLMAGETVSVWWQILAYGVLTAGEVLVSITALEFSYKQAPLTIKSFIMSLFLVSTSLGNFGIAAVNNLMQRPLQAKTIEAGDETWVTLEGANEFVTGQKIDLTGDTGLMRNTVDEAGVSKKEKLEGTFLVAEVAGARVRLMDNNDRKPVVTTGSFNAEKGKVSTYWLVGPMYFLFFIVAMLIAAVIFIFVALAYKEETHVRDEGATAT
jgi:proton-dependent oligopeptide transporter, POT family